MGLVLHGRSGPGKEGLVGRRQRLPRLLVDKNEVLNGSVCGVGEGVRRLPEPQGLEVWTGTEEYAPE